MKAKIYITYKDGVLDPQGATVFQVLRQQGNEDIRNVRFGKMVEIELNDMPRAKAEAMLKEISDRVLANPVIEKFQVELP
jgi:phosphoribosylformylglycinamidine synthase